MTLTIAFDCDNTLIDWNEEPREEIVTLCRALAAHFKVIIWSGGGREYAQTVARRCRLEDIPCFAKFAEGLPVVDIAIDDDQMIRGVRWLLRLEKGNA